MSVDFSVLRTECLFVLIHSLFRADKPPLGFFLFRWGGWKSSSLSTAVSVDTIASSTDNWTIWCHCYYGSLPGSDDDTIMGACSGCIRFKALAQPSHPWYNYYKYNTKRHVCTSKINHSLMMRRRRHLLTKQKNKNTKRKTESDLKTWYTWYESMGRQENSTTSLQLSLQVMFKLVPKPVSIELAWKPQV